jgi:hypothetical protein
MPFSGDAPTYDLDVGLGRIGDGSDALPVVWHPRPAGGSRRVYSVSAPRRVQVVEPVVPYPLPRSGGAARLRAAYGLDVAPPLLVNLLA